MRSPAVICFAARQLSVIIAIFQQSIYILNSVLSCWHFKIEKMSSKHLAHCTSCYFLVVIFVVLRCSNGAPSAPLVPAMFVLGDSLVDNGNNNYLSSMAKANYYPYGIDFFQGPTGRFCNGKTVVDALCDLLGLPYLPPYTSPFLSGTAMLGGVNYASAAGGIMDESGQFLGQRYSLRQQVLNFQTTLSQLRSLMPARNLTEYLARSIVMIVIGSNDYINNYLLPSLYPTSFNYTPEQYANLLLNHYTRQLLALYSVGLRKFFLTGLGPLGCIPNQRASGLAPAGRCVDQVNQMLGSYNVGLRTLVQQLNANHPGAMFVYGNTYAAIGDILNNPGTCGFTVVDRGCCGLGRNRGQITCLPFVFPCSDRDEHVFWDAFHPTQAVNLILAQRAFTGPPSDCFPINIQQMAQL